MNPVHSYIVRLYRRDRRALAGVVIDLESGNSRYFHSISSLCTALAGRAGRRGPDAATPTGRTRAKPA